MNPISSIHPDFTANLFVPICRGFELHGLSVTAVPRSSWRPTPASTQSRHSALAGFTASVSSPSSQPTTTATPHQQPRFRLRRSHVLPQRLPSYPSAMSPNDSGAMSSRFFFHVSLESNRTPRLNFEVRHWLVAKNALIGVVRRC